MIDVEHICSECPKFAWTVVELELAAKAQVSPENNHGFRDNLGGDQKSYKSSP